MPRCRVAVDRPACHGEPAGAGPGPRSAIDLAGEAFDEVVGGGEFGPGGGQIGAVAGRGRPRLGPRRSAVPMAAARSVRAASRSQAARASAVAARPASASRAVTRCRSVPTSAVAGGDLGGAAGWRRRGPCPGRWWRRRRRPGLRRGADGGVGRGHGTVQVGERGGAYPFGFGDRGGALLGEREGLVAAGAARRHASAASPDGRGPGLVAFGGTGGELGAQGVELRGEFGGAGVFGVGVRSGRVAFVAVPGGVGAGVLRLRGGPRRVRRGRRRRAGRLRRGRRRSAVPRRPGSARRAGRRPGWWRRVRGVRRVPRRGRPGRRDRGSSAPAFDRFARCVGIRRCCRGSTGTGARRHRSAAPAGHSRHTAGGVGRDRRDASSPMGDQRTGRGAGDVHRRRVTKTGPRVPVWAAHPRGPRCGREPEVTA